MAAPPIDEDAARLTVTLALSLVAGLYRLVLLLDEDDEDEEREDAGDAEVVADAARLADGVMERF